MLAQRHPSSLAHPKRRGNRWEHELRIVQWCEVDHERTVFEAVERLDGNLEREPGLPGSSRAR
jgi:hypothetical protein